MMRRALLVLLPTLWAALPGHPRAQSLWNGTQFNRIAGVPLQAADLNAAIAYAIAQGKAGGLTQDQVNALIGSGIASNISGVLALANGGTGASTAATARSNLGLAAVAASGAYGDLSGTPSLAPYATLANPTFTGSPAAPTATPGTSTTQLATTAFVQNAVVAATAGVASFNSRTGAVTLTTSDLTGAGGAPQANPTFTGTPAAPTAAAGTSTAQIATTAFVTSALLGALPIAGGTMTGALNTAGLVVNGTDDASTAWTSNACTLTIGTGSMTSGSCTLRSKRIGKTVIFNLVITITTNGTAAGYIAVAMPYPAATSAGFGGRETAVTGKSLAASVYAGSTTLYINNYDGAYPGANGYSLVVNGVYEST